MENNDQGFHTYQPVGKLHVSPNSGKRTYLPEVDESLKPKDKMTFDTVNNAFLFYQKYAMASGCFIMLFVCTQNFFVNQCC
ncbi:hypothetical protein HanIR_Chr02g0086121 [Helianthus annuus]|nr:hypothetical protein HanIR_Chr02g0086121 [Helianthus annuus]